MQKTVYSSTPSVEDAKRVARRLLEKYDRTRKGSLSQQDMSAILGDVYTEVKYPYQPSGNDASQYFSVLDVNRDQKVSIEDLEQLCIKYLCTSDDNIVHEHKSHAHRGYQGSSNYNTYTTSSHQHYQPSSSNTQYSSHYQPQTTTYSSNNYSSQNYKSSTQQYTTSYGTRNEEKSHYHDDNYENLRGSYLKHEYEQPQTIYNHKNKKINLPQGNVKFNSKNVFAQGCQGGMSGHMQQKLKDRHGLRDPSRVGYEAGQKIQQIKSQWHGRKYTDQEFPPNDTSLSRIGEWYDGEPIPARQWIRPEQYFHNGYELFQDGIMPGDIKQGQLGDCYFQCSLAAIAEWPERIQRIFTSPEKSQCGAYSVWIVFNGVREEVVVDDNLWYDGQYQEFVSMQSNGEEIWPQIIEKAWAKLNKDYMAIDGGFARDALHDLTGAPVIHYRIAEQSSWNKVKELLWKELLEGEQDNFIMCGATYGEDPSGYSVGDSDSRDGIFYSHAYSILAAYEIYVDGRSVRLCKVRNPHGEGEYTGPYSDKDSVWRRVSQADKQRLEVSDEDDGVFFIEYDKLRTYFEDIQVCQYRDNYRYKGLKIEAGQGEQEHFLKVTIPPSQSGDGYYYFQLNQRARAEFGEESRYQYQRATVNVVDANGRYISAAQGRQKNICSYKSQQLPKTLPPGTYYVLTKCVFDWHQKEEGVYRYGFGVYGKEQVQIEQVSPNQIPQNVVSQLRNPSPAVNEILPSFVI